MSDPRVKLELTWTEARALAYASDLGLNAEPWPSPEYKAHAARAREVLLMDTSKSETQYSEAPVRAHPQGGTRVSDA